VCPPDDGAPREDEVASFIGELNEAFPALDLQRSDVTLVHRGVVPAAPGADGSVSLEGHERIHDHASDGIEGLLTVAGTKYTTARGSAERVIDRAMRKLGREAVPCRTAVTPLPGGDLGDVIAAVAAARRDHDARLPSDTIPHLVAAYGSRFPQILELADQRPEWRSRVADDSPVIGAELVWAVRQEMALTLGDAVIRRTPLGALGYPGDVSAERAGDIVGNELGWSVEKKNEELEALRAFYRL
jgi:glycerol-3-phosphate dehydrogenase